ncbi:hypothetical protein GQ651_09280 [Alphaproteobacteria bacterium GH1-50]|uniref:Uncharacterized protein n=1 Tax=Kangsaoukella pontilimi TaxID=2691042 RepID=A0A7C9MX05_9RHOB|nr:hypothetical protein [Kangsaoukella pontilimi]MXQ08034.1 hypothetical protein [Kangsaoukella pontilimi]
MPTRIKVLVPNPKRGKSIGRFDQYRDGMTVDQYIDACGRLGYPPSKARADIKWDLERNFIELYEA